MTMQAGRRGIWCIRTAGAIMSLCVVEVDFCKFLDFIVSLATAMGTCLGQYAVSVVRVSMLRCSSAESVCALLRLGPAHLDTSRNAL